MEPGPYFRSTALPLYQEDEETETSKIHESLYNKTKFHRQIEVVEVVFKREIINVFKVTGEFIKFAQSKDGLNLDESEVQAIVNKSPNLDESQKMSILQLWRKNYGGFEADLKIRQIVRRFYKIQEESDFDDLCDGKLRFFRKDLPDWQNVFLGEFGHRFCAIRQIISNDTQALVVAKILLKENPENVISVLHADTSSSPEQCIIISTELAWTKNLPKVFEEIKWSKISFSDDMAINLATQILFALEFFHNHEIIYGRLVPENILISDDKTRLKLCNFEESKEVSYYESHSRKFLFDDGYQPPEVYTIGKECKASNIFSAGVVLAEIFSHGVHPFGDDPRSRGNNVKKHLKPDLNKLCIYNRKEAEELIVHMLDQIPKNRPTAIQVFADIKFLQYSFKKDPDQNKSHHSGQLSTEDEVRDTLVEVKVARPATKRKIPITSSGVKLSNAPLEADEPIDSKRIKIEDPKIQYYSDKGLGSRSNVFEGVRTGVTKEKIAVKFITYCLEDNTREVQHLIDTKACEYVVRYFQSGECLYNHKRAIFIAMELCEARPLSDRIGKDKLPYETRKKYVHCIAKGLQHLKDKHIMHRDLKPQNILFRDGSPVISDFGLSKKHPENKSNTNLSRDDVGTDGWRAPETSERESRISYDADIYSAGLLFFFILTDGKHPYGKKWRHWQTLIDRDVNGIDLNLEAIHETPDGAIAFDLIKLMLKRKPKERPSIEEVLKHPFFFDTEKRLKFLSTAHKTVEFMNTLQKAGKSGSTPLDLNCSKDKLYGEKIYEIKGWNAEKLLLTTDEVTSIEGNFEQKGESIEVSKDAMLKKAKKFGDSVTELLRFVRNREAHDLEDNAGESIDMTKDQFLKFFSDRFPHFFIYVFYRFKQYYTQKNKSDRDFSAEMAKYVAE